MRFLSTRIRSNETNKTVRYSSFDADDESVIPPPPQYTKSVDDDDSFSIPPPPPLQSPPPQEYPQLPAFSDDVSAMTAPSELSGMVKGEVQDKTEDTTPSSQSLKGEKFLKDDIPSSASAAIELELAIYERLERAKKVETDLVEDTKYRSDRRKQKFCIGTVLFLALLALSIGLATGLKKGSGGDLSNEAQETERATDRPEATGASKTIGPVTRVDMSIKLIGLSPKDKLPSGASDILEQEYCSYFVRYYNQPQKKDWLRSNIDVAECKIEVKRNRRLQMRNLQANEGLIVNFAQTVALSYPTAKNETYISNSIDNILEAPFTSQLGVSSLVDELKNDTRTEAFINLQDIVFGPEPVVAVITSSPTASPTDMPTQSPTRVPTTLIPTPVPTSKPTDPPRPKNKDKKNKRNQQKA